MEGTSSGPPATVSTAELAAQITELAGHLNAANRRWLALIAEFDRRRGRSDSLTRSCAHWLNWQCGIDMGAAREKVRALTRVAGPATEQVFLSIALHGTAHHVETIVRQYRRATEAAELARRGAEHVREVESRIGGHATLALDEFVEPRLRPADLTCERRLRLAGGAQELLQQHLARMDRVCRMQRALLRHACPVP